MYTLKRKLQWTTFRADLIRSAIFFWEPPEIESPIASKTVPSEAPSCLISSLISSSILLISSSIPMIQTLVSSPWAVASALIKGSTQITQLIKLLSLFFAGLLLLWVIDPLPFHAHRQQHQYCGLHHLLLRQKAFSSSDNDFDPVRIFHTQNDFWTFYYDLSVYIGRCFSFVEK